VANRSAGILLYRRAKNEILVLLVHPGGPFWKKRDLGAWSIPKGEHPDEEAPEIAARREFAEETNLVVLGDFIVLTPVQQRNRKVVHVWAFEADFDLTPFSSNTFEIEWPPRSGRRQRFPEIDRIAYFTLPVAMTKILAYQRPLLRELEQHLGSSRA